MKTTIRLIIIRFVLMSCGVVGIAHSVFAEPFHGLRYEVLKTRTEDGVHLVLFHMLGREGGKPVLLEPGLAETAETMDGFAKIFFDHGYDVYIGQSRLAGRRKHISDGGARNGLPEVLLKDFPAHFRGVLNHARQLASPAQSRSIQVHLVGHSMGGMEILAAYSNAKLAQEFEPHTAGATLVTAPSDLVGIPGPVREESRLLLPFLKRVRKSFRVRTLALHHYYFDGVDLLRGSKGKVAPALAWGLEHAFVKFGSLILRYTLVSMNHTSHESLRRLFSDELSAPPYDLLIDFAEAAISGQFLDSMGEKLILPEKIRIPLQVVAAERDYLAPRKQQDRLFESAGSQVKRMMILKGMMHMDPVLVDNPNASAFLNHVVNFHDDPKFAVEAHPRLVFFPQYGKCEAILVGGQ